jgi:RNA polymerase sigma factor (sigma-70 family)
MTVHTGHHTLAEQVSAAIRRHREGDAGALGELFYIVRPWLQHIALACRVGRHSADDVVQSTMETAIINLPRLRDPNAGLAWLSVIARREAVRVSREERRTDLIGEHEEFADTADTADPERLVLSHIARDALLRALAKLPERHRTLLTLLFLDDRFDYATIAIELNMPVGSIGPTRQRGLKKVRALLIDDEEDYGYARCA